MKLLRLPILFFVLAMPVILFAQAGQDSAVKKCFLDMQGRILYGKKGLQGATATVYADNTLAIVKQVETDEKGRLGFQLPVEKSYTIKLSKPGFVTKIITVDARMPRHDQTGDYFFEFSSDLFEELPGLDVSMLKEPVAKIFFNTFGKKFDYDFNYTAKILSDLKKLYDDYKVLSKNKGSSEKK